jgi:hypothetical protein
MCAHRCFGQVTAADGSEDELFDRDALAADFPAAVAAFEAATLARGAAADLRDALARTRAR